MATVSEVDICNLAIGWVGGQLLDTTETDIADVEETDNDAVTLALCQANYPVQRDILLEKADWSFAIAHDTLTAETTPVDTLGFANRFAKPADCLRVVGVYTDSAFLIQADWTISEGYIAADESTLYIRYIAQVSTTSKFSPGFVDALAAKIAAELAVPLAHSRTLQADLLRIFGEKLANAATMDGMQGRKIKFRNSRLVNARYGDQSFYFELGV